MLNDENLFEIKNCRIGPNFRVNLSQQIKRLVAVLPKSKGSVIIGFWPKSRMEGIFAKYVSLGFWFSFNGLESLFLNHDLHSSYFNCASGITT